MKRLKSILLIIAVCLVLSSCAELDEMKSIHALDYGNGTVKLNNQIYILLDIEYDGYIVYDHGNDIRVTEPDVPVLLSQSRIEKYLPSVSKDGTIISYNGLYIREDKYDFYVNTIKNGIEYTRYYCGTIGYQSSFPNYYFNVIENSNFDTFINSVPSVKSTEPIYSDNNVWISCESADGIFRNGPVYQLVKTDDGYCVLEYTNKGYYYRYDSTPEYDELFEGILNSAKAKE